MYLTSTGLVCPVGFSSEVACAAMRAGIDGFTELPYVDNSGEVIIGAMVPGLDPELGREDRLIQLLVPAIRECVTGLDPEHLAGVPLLIGLSEPERFGSVEAFGNRIVPEIERQLGIRFLDGFSKVIPTGRTAGFEALHAARVLMQTRDVAACLICGVDSYVNARSLHWLDQHQRLKHSRNSDGVIPGEGAAAVMLSALRDISAAAPARVCGLGFAMEEATVMSEEPPLLGLGLTEASKTALADAGIQMHEIGFRISDVTGESYGFREQALTVGRLLRVRREEGFPIWHASECIGDTGSVAGMIQLIVAFYAYQKGYAPGEIAMCFVSGDLGKRAVVLLTSNTPTRLGT